MAEALDVSGQKIGPDGARLMATFIKNNGALTALNISNNNLTRGALKKYPGYSEAGYRSESQWGEKDGDYETSMAGVIALADGIKNNGALASLNLASNGIGAEGAKHVAEAMKALVSQRWFV